MEGEEWSEKSRGQRDGSVMDDRERDVFYP